MKSRLVLSIILFAMVGFMVNAFSVMKSSEDNVSKITISKDSNMEIRGRTLISGIAEELFSAELYNEVYGGVEELYWDKGWINASCVNIRSGPSKKTEILETLNYNDCVEFYHVNNNWSRIRFKSGEAYVHSEFIYNEEMVYKDYPVPVTNGFKSFMSYRAITNSGTLQYKLQKSAHTGKYGIRQVDNRYCVAIGTSFTSSIGQYFDLILENGEIIPCILGDVKADIHTDSGNRFTISNGCASEFIVDMKSLNRKARINGDISSCCKAWDSRISTIRVYDKNYFDHK